MNKSDDFTHQPRAIDPRTFRAKATGVGQSQEMSLNTGMRRAQRVIDSTSEQCRKAIPAAEGYPAPTDTSANGMYRG